MLYALLYERAELRLLGYISFRIAMAAFTAFALSLWWGKHVIAWLAARSDGPAYGRLVAFLFPKQRLVFGHHALRRWHWRLRADPRAAR